MSKLRWWRRIAVLSLCAACTAIFFSFGRNQVERGSTDSDRFGLIRTFLGSSDPQRAYLLFASADDWSGPATDVALGLARAGDLVIGIDETAYHQRLAADDGDCIYVAGEIQRLSQSVESGMKLPRYLYPVLIGIGDGASLAYSVLAQHPEPVFGGVLINFSGQYPLKRNFCAGDYLISSVDSGSVKFSANEDLPITAVGITLPDCNNSSYENMFAEVRPAPAASSNSVSSSACGRAIYAAVRAVQPDTEVPGRNGEKVSDAENALIELLPDEASSDYFVLFLSGDGGWATIDKKLGEYLQTRGVPVLGFDSLEYFWQRKTREQAGKDIVGIIDKYSRELRRDRFALVGFSMGADLIPFILNKLPEKLRKRAAGVALLSPGRLASFEVHISDWIGIEETADDKPILPELKQLGPLNIACYYGEEESENSLCTTGAPQLDRIVRFPGGHHFDDHYDDISKDLYEFLNSKQNVETPTPVANITDGSRSAAIPTPSEAAPALVPIPTESQSAPVESPSSAPTAK